ncbi:Ovarian tumor otubain [Penicillium cf. griseofulvum]|uniref:Ubiquitin thioesterase OTU n=1 Tax=Penicillium cf. griseofulvum TaxID=2972120 RepID=A0A9W9MZA5_9EURO|nr:Ovarian tumor otubain [Penicillium cf. griseofulvum]KAJ5421689.1 Ovarian tumor otubain [Penicillium cf. griseofulvum]
MRIRVRGPSGQSTVILDDSATIKDLQTQIAEKTGLATFDVKYGYPLKPLELGNFQPDQRILEVGIHLNGESLIVAQKEGATRGVGDDAPTAPSQPSQPSMPLKPHENIAEDPPEIASPEHAGTFVLRVMPDDNSCLFRAVGAAVMGDMDTMVELRSIVAGAIQSNPTEYTAAILGKKPDEYCTWIQNEDSWGGAIELKILSEYFNIEICSIDVQTLNMFQFNEGAPTRCIVVYSGIHYDVLALSPSRSPYTRANPLPHNDTKIFEAIDPVVLQKAKELCRVLQGKHYYTDTSGFTVRCNICGGTFTGERGATKHAAETGHYDFGEAS